MTLSKQKHPWLKVRTYRHFDWPIVERRFPETEQKISDPVFVAKHGFYPLISSLITSPRYKREKNKVEMKERPVSYAAHLDAQIFSYYSHLLGAKYESFLAGQAWGDCPIAYRKVEGKCNIHFALDAFQEIRSRRDCAVLCFDVTSFFDSLNHRLLKDAVTSLFGFGSLPDDYYNVLSNVCRYSCIDLGDLKELLPKDRFEKNEFAPYCDLTEFKRLVRGSGRIRKNANGFGIPQGLPLSGVLSNIYMIPFDRRIHSLCSERGAYFRRYSDDIIVVCSAGDAPAFRISVAQALSERWLKVQEQKTEITTFSAEPDGRLSCRPAKGVQYLGFVFDGARIHVRSSSISRYWRRLIQSVYMQKKEFANLRKKNPSARLSKKVLLSRFSHLGRRNFYGYVRRAATQMNEPAIRRQMRRHWKILWREIDGRIVGPRTNGVLELLLEKTDSEPSE
jgi:hypothetical protein